MQPLSWLEMNKINRCKVRQPSSCQPQSRTLRSAELQHLSLDWRTLIFATGSSCVQELLGIYGKLLHRCIPVQSWALKHIQMRQLTLHLLLLEVISALRRESLHISSFTADIMLTGTIYLSSNVSQCNWNSKYSMTIQTHTRLTAIFQRQTGWADPVPER